LIMALDIVFQAVNELGVACPTGHVPLSSSHCVAVTHAGGVVAVGLIMPVVRLGQAIGMGVLAVIVLLGGEEKKDE